MKREKKREMFYLTTHSNTFYLQLVKDHSDSEKGNLLLLHRLLLLINSKGFLYAPSHRQDNTAFVTPVVEHWLDVCEKVQLNELLLITLFPSCEITSLATNLAQLLQ